MPIYEYRCESCTTCFETLVRRRDETVSCPQCGSDQLQKLLSAHAIGHGAPDTACGAAPCLPAPACSGGSCGNCA